MFKRKESVFIIVLFLVFFPIYAVFNNAILYLFDQIFTGGEVSKLFSYNYLGEFVGCLGSAKYQDLAQHYNVIQKHGALTIQFLVSLITFSILWKRKTYKSPVYKWMLVFVFSLFLFTSLWFLYSFFRFQPITDSTLIKQVFWILTCSVITFILAITLFLKRFNTKEKLQVFLLVCPASFISAYLWFGYIGPALLPI